MRDLLKIDFDGSSFQFAEFQTYESRGKSISKMILSAYDALSKEEKKRVQRFSALFYVGDMSLHPYSICGKRNTNMLIPCYFFLDWPEIGVTSYTETCKEMLIASQSGWKDSRLFWIGNSNTNISRKKFLEIAKKDDRILAIDCGNWNGDSGKKKTPVGGYVSLPDHCNYRYLLDIEGHSYSARLKALLHSGRTLFYQDREWKEYWEFDLIPFVHYIPVKNDLSNLLEMLDWADSNQEKCDAIAKNAAEFASKYLKYENAIDRYKNIIMMLGA